MTIQIVYNKRSHRGPIAEEKQIITFCTNDCNLLKKMPSGNQMLAVYIEKYRTYYEKHGKTQREITHQIPMPRHDSEQIFTERPMQRTLYVLLDKFGKTLFGALDRAYIEQKADYLENFPKEIRAIKKPF